MGKIHDGKDQKTHNGEHHHHHGSNRKHSPDDGSNDYWVYAVLAVAGLNFPLIIFLLGRRRRRRGSVAAQQSSAAAQQSSVAAQQSSVAAQQSSVVAQPMYPVINNERKMQHSIQAVPDTRYIPLSTHV